MVLTFGALANGRIRSFCSGLTPFRKPIPILIPGFTETAGIKPFSTCPKPCPGFIARLIECLKKSNWCVSVVASPNFLHLKSAGVKMTCVLIAAEHLLSRLVMVLVNLVCLMVAIMIRMTTRFSMGNCWCLASVFVSTAIVLSLATFCPSSLLVFWYLANWQVIDEWKSY